MPGTHASRPTPHNGFFAADSSRPVARRGLGATAGAVNVPRTRPPPRAEPSGSVCRKCWRVYPRYSAPPRQNPPPTPPTATPVWPLPPPSHRRASKPPHRPASRWRRLGVAPSRCGVISVWRHLGVAIFLCVAIFVCRRLAAWCWWPARHVSAAPPGVPPARRRSPACRRPSRLRSAFHHPSGTLPAGFPHRPEGFLRLPGCLARFPQASLLLP